jgi:hypothetical protein
MKRIALTGLARSGKSTAADYLVKRYHFQRLSYAAPMKRMIRCLLIESGAGFVEAHEMVDGIHKEEGTHLLQGRSPRYALQNLGTEFGRHLIAPDIWRAILLRKVRHSQHPVVVDDLRFADEAADLKAEGFTLIRIVRPGSGTTLSHVSEGQEFDVDHVIENTGDLSTLFAQIDTL